VTNNPPENAENLPAFSARSVVAQQLRIFEGLASTTPDFLYAFDLEGRFLFANRRLLEVWGMKSTDIVGKTCRELGYEQWHHDMHMREIAQVIRTKQPIIGEVPFKAPLTGVYGVYEYIFTPVFDDSGNVAFIAGTTRDVTTRKKMEEAMRDKESRFSAALQIAELGTFEWNLKTNDVVLDERSREIFGFSATEPVTGMQVVEKIEPLDFDRVQMQARQAIAAQERLETEYRVNAKPGTVRIILCICDALPNPSGEAERIIGVFADVTARREAAELVRKSEARYRELFSSMADAFCVLERLEGAPGRPTEFRVVEANPAFEQHSGLGRNAVGKTLSELVGTEATYWSSLYDQVLQSGEPLRMQNNLAATSRTLDLYAYRVGTGAQRQVGVVFRDITDRKRSEEALARAQQALREHATSLEHVVEERTAKLRDTISELEHFSYTITHDLRAPLRSMQAFAELLRSDYDAALDDAGRDYVSRIRAAASRMDTLITDALNYARAVQTELRLESIQPEPLLREIIQTYPQFHQVGAEIGLSGVFPAVFANKAGLTQCFSNLLDNGTKFVKAGTTPRLRVYAERRGPTVRIWFEDNGIGIGPEHKERVFGMFQQLHKGYAGTGVGLALVRKVVTRMQGNVGFESVPGCGSRFWLELHSADH
jgi:PAS domain S-box-containing protein